MFSEGKRVVSQNRNPPVFGSCSCQALLQWMCGCVWSLGPPGRHCVDHLNCTVLPGAFSHKADQTRSGISYVVWPCDFLTDRKLCIVARLKCPSSVEWLLRSSVCGLISASIIVICQTILRVLEKSTFLKLLRRLHEVAITILGNKWQKIKKTLNVFVILAAGFHYLCTTALVLPLKAL